MAWGPEGLGLGFASVSQRRRVFLRVFGAGEQRGVFKLVEPTVLSQLAWLSLPSPQEKNVRVQAGWALGGRADTLETTH